ncbi:hypothetical protein [Micromonospora sp. DT227]|uniref:hypothetical protein n=1 Tax=Micromonospora sp. DT227 TaxID=3393433 RepID=UPI003CE6C9D2
MLPLPDLPPVLPISARLAVWMTRAELGDLATWIGSLANIATLGLALLAGVVSFRVYKIESGRDQRAEDERRERAEDDRRGQADLVSVWYGRSSGKMVTQWAAIGGGERIFLRWAAHILNGSNLPIYDVTVFFSLLDSDDQTVRTWIAESIRVVPPREQPRIVVLPSSFSEVLPDEDLRDRIAVAVEFRDTAGRRWIRDNMGYLHRAADMTGKQSRWSPSRPAG